MKRPRWRPDPAPDGEGWLILGERPRPGVRSDVFAQIYTFADGTAHWSIVAGPFHASGESRSVKAAKQRVYATLDAGRAVIRRFFA